MGTREAREGSGDRRPHGRLCVTPAPAPEAGPRDPKARPNPADVWHSRQVHVGAGGQRRPVTARAHARPGPTPGRGRVEQALALRTPPPSFSAKSPRSQPALGSKDPLPPPRPHHQSPRVRIARQLQIARGAAPGHAGSCSSLALPGRTLRHSSRKEELRLPACPRRKDAPARPATGTPAAGKISLPAVVSVAAAAPEPPPPPPRWAVFRFLFFGIVGRPVPRRLGAQRGSADGAALFTRASVRRAAERRGFG